MILQMSIPNCVRVRLFISKTVWYSIDKTSTVLDLKQLIQTNNEIGFNPIGNGNMLDKLWVTYKGQPLSNQQLIMDLEEFVSGDVIDV